MPWEADFPVQIISLLLFIFFLVELVLQIYVGMDFFYITLDAFATASLVFDFLPLLSVLTQLRDGVDVWRPHLPTLY